jgi:beta-fructofuranosidase
MAEWKDGSVVHALPNSTHTEWIRSDRNPLITRPTELGVTDFRDPQIRKTETGWKLLMAAGTSDGIGAIVEYESEDLLDWQLNGIIADSNSGLAEPAPQSTVWECPQLFELDGKWVLIISAMDANGQIGVRYALGEYDGNRFTPNYWGNFCHSGELYASSLFYDTANKPNLISWFKETGDVSPEGSEWTSAQSLPMELRVIESKLRAFPRSDFEFTPFALTETIKSDESVAVRLSGSAWKLEIAGPNPWSIDCENGQLTITTSNSRTFAVGDSSVFFIVIDADICEIFADGIEGVIATRCPANGVMVLSLNEI